MSDNKTIQGNDAVQQLVKQGRTENPPDETYDEGLPVETFTLQRDNSIPLQFRGRRIGWTEPNEEATVGTRVSVFVTQKGTLITHIYQWQRKDGFKGEGLAPMKRSRNVAGVHVEAQEALAWLIQEGGGELGSASRKAWEMACAKWPPLQGQIVEIID